MMVRYGGKQKQKKRTYGGNTKAIDSIDTQKNKGYAMKGLERIRVSVVVGGSSWVCRDVDHSERMMEPNDGIRLPVTEKKRSTK